MTARDERVEIIHRLEELRGSRDLTYVTSDRTGTQAQIGDDAVRFLNQHLRELGPLEKLDLYIYSRGGATDVPWRIVSAFRNRAKE